jgi:hypothetical protein
VRWGVFRDHSPKFYGPVATSDEGYRRRDGGRAGVVRAPPSTTNIIVLAALSYSSSSPLPDDNIRIHVGPTALITTTTGYFMPPDWSEQVAVWMVWPYMRSIWSRHFKLACQGIINLISVIMRYQTVKLIVRAENLSGARHCLPVEWDVIPDPGVHLVR